MDEDILKRRMLSNYCLFFLKEDLKEHILELTLKKQKIERDKKMMIYFKGTGKVQTKLGVCYYSENELEHNGETDLMIGDDIVVGSIYDEDGKIKIEIFEEFDE